MAERTRIEELRRRVQLHPASIAFAALAEEYRRAGEYEQAIETCLTGLRRHPAYLSPRVTLGRALMELGRYEEAQKELEFVRRAAPENLAAIRALAEIHEHRGELPQPAEQPPVAPEGSAAPVPLPAPARRVPHPDEAALPALEAFLAAVLRARKSARAPILR